MLMAAGCGREAGGAGGGVGCAGRVGGDGEGNIRHRTPLATTMRE